MSNETYNPLDKLRLGESVAKALLARPVSDLPPPGSFIGAGIYALYYIGNFPPYRKIADKNINDQWSAPLYVGKAVPAGARKGGYGLGKTQVKFCIVGCGSMQNPFSRQKIFL